MSTRITTGATCDACPDDWLFSGRIVQPFGDSIFRAARLAAAASICCAALCSLSTRVVAQEYPTRTIKVVTNVSVGGTFDIFMRALGEDLQKRWNKPVVIEPRPGGNFIIAGRACAESAPDGYTICALSGETLVYTEFLNKSLPFDPRKSLTPVTNLFFNTQALVVTSALNVTSLEELARLAKAKPKTLAYMAPAIPHRLFMERFNMRHGTDIVSVPFKGGGDAISSMLTGTTPITFFGAANFQSFIAQGTMVGLAVDGAARSPLYPAVPTLAELGYADKMTRVYLGIVVPAGTPGPIIDRLHSVIAAIIGEPAFRERHLLARGLEPIANTSSEFERFLTDDRILSEQTVEAAGLKPQ